ncbi:amino acid transporter-like protein [Rhizodiscina lignyota]|uniref:Amino acid transporter-like protein n=1 Tax=Rhizodiscina lignyota TaxID=1504668 RepID=A0A9P4M974_9PEZI|nr:amino acid transporter-like protein [Rhizodiscina lignyota]
MADPPEGDDEKVFEGSTVPERFRGTSTDVHDMAVLGKTQVLRRNFSFNAIFGFSSTVMVAWEILPVISVFALTDGGTAILFWALVAGCIGMTFVYASLAEMASMCPTAGGQYHWVSEFAPPSIQKELSYTVGWLCAMGWQVYLAGICFMVGSVLQGLIVLNDDSYVWHSWHGTLLTIAVIVFSIAFNTILADRLPYIEIVAVAIHFLGLFGIIIPLWVTADRGNAHDVLLTFTNTGGWQSTGLACMIGVVTPVGLLIGYDCSVHMSEETQDASRVLPKSIMWSTVLNGLMAFIMGTTFVFCLGNLDDVLATPTYEPFLAVFYNATNSLSGTNTMAAIIVIMLIFACISEVATASRQLWSFARDRGVPFSGWLSHVSPHMNIPIRAVTVSLIISTLLSLINIGSSVALNAINSLGVLSILASYYITIGCLVWRRLFGAPLPQRRWSLGKYGLGINIVALLFITPLLFFDTWPLYRDVTAENLNWSPVMFVGVLLIAAFYYVVKARHQYTGPVVLVKRNA